jgi:hypothetical protein
MRRCATGSFLQHCILNSSNLTGSLKYSSTHCSRSKVRANLLHTMVKLYTIRVISRPSRQTIITLVKNRWITEAEWLAHFTTTGAYQECHFQCVIRMAQRFLGLYFTKFFTNHVVFLNPKTFSLAFTKTEDDTENENVHVSLVVDADNDHDAQLIIGGGE